MQRALRTMNQVHSGPLGTTNGSTICMLEAEFEMVFAYVPLVHSAGFPSCQPTEHHDSPFGEANEQQTLAKECVKRADVKAPLAEVNIRTV